MFFMIFILTLFQKIRNLITLILDNHLKWLVEIRNMLIYYIYYFKIWDYLKTVKNTKNVQNSVLINNMVVERVILLKIIHYSHIRLKLVAQLDYYQMAIQLLNNLLLKLNNLPRDNIYHKYKSWATSMKRYLVYMTK